jgi:glycosyltransferase involved in cell wall biosynthesis
MQHILHICSGYSQQSLYRELILELSKTNIKQTIYVPVRSFLETGKNDIKGIKNVTVIYSHLLQKKHRVLYHLKINIILADIEKNVNLSTIDVIHAHFLFSDGGVAYKIKVKYGIPFIATIRNTDVNVFFKYMLHLRGWGQKIIKSSRKIVFITPAYRSLLIKRFRTSNFSNQIDDSLVIPNGLNPSWLENSFNFDKPNFDSIRLLYVGDFSKNKNVIRLLNIIKSFSKKMDIKLTLAGGGGNGHQSVLNILNQGEFKFAKYIGRIEGTQALKELYSSHHVFIMISKFETFGLVYLEAMSQGLPVIHTLGQGIDGYFENSSFAKAVNPNCERDIFISIENIIDNYEIASKEARRASKTFLWKEIAEKYIYLYNN